MFTVSAGVQHFTSNVLHGSYHGNSVRIHSEKSGRLRWDCCIPFCSVGFTCQEDLVDSTAEGFWWLFRWCWSKEKWVNKDDLSKKRHRGCSSSLLLGIFPNLILFLIKNLLMIIIMIILTIMDQYKNWTMRLFQNNCTPSKKENLTFAKQHLSLGIQGLR